MLSFLEVVKRELVIASILGSPIRSQIGAGQMVDVVKVPNAEFTPKRIVHRTRSFSLIGILLYRCNCSIDRLDGFFRGCLVFRCLFFERFSFLPIASLNAPFLPRPCWLPSMRTSRFFGTWVVSSLASHCYM